MSAFRTVIALAPILWCGFTPAAEWIWSPGERHEPNAAVFTKSFSAGAGPETARLTVTGDFAAIEVILNGETIAEIEAYDPVLVLDLAPFLTIGENQIVLAAVGVEGPSAVAAKLEIDALTLETGETWGDAKSFGDVRPERFAPNALPDISRFDEYNQWNEATEGAVAKLSPLPAGFDIELLRTAREGEDSWVSMVFDPKGRIIIGKEKQGLLRLTLPKTDGVEIKVETIEDTLLECRGLLWAYDSLYANANNSKGLYRLRDTDGDDRFDEVKLLKQTGGGVGHGRNDLAIGPDGLIYSIHGDSVEIAEGEKMLPVPEIEGAKPKGHLARMDKDGNGWEILTRGLRNPYGIDFNTDGEPFTYDADNEGDVGLPLYRPTRVNHLVSGANYGWLQSADPSWSVPVWAPDTWPTTCDIGRGSPTSVKFGTKSNFPTKWRDALFALDWAYGRIIAVHFTPRGASYYATAQEFLRGRPLNVTGLDFGPDGAMYFVTGGRKTQAALYRISYHQDVAGAGTPPSEQEVARAEFSARTRELRRKLESEDADANLIWRNLDSPDPWIGGAARVAFERKRRAGEIGQGPAPSTTALGMARTGASLQGMFSVLAKLDLKSRAEKLTLLRAYEIAGVADSTEIRFQLEAIYPDQDARVNRELCKLLVKFDSAVVVDRTRQLLAGAASQFDRLFYLEQLSFAKSGWTPELRQSFVRSFIHARLSSSGDTNLPGYLNRIEERALANAPDAEREALKALLADSVQPVVDPPAQTRPLVKPWTLADFAGDKLEGGDPAKGRDLFGAALCARCHQFGSLGTPVGPDLTTVASRFSRPDLLQSIITPSEVVAEPYWNYLITKKDGSTLMGRVVREDFRKSTLFVSSNVFAPNELAEVSKPDIVTYEATPVSPMPPGLLDTLTREEILDLLAFLENGG